MEEITTDEAPASIGPYSQAIRDGDTVYTSGQGPIDPETGEVLDGDIAEQTALTLENIAAVLEAAGTSLDNVLKATVYVGDMEDYGAVNDAYAEYMSEPFPARSAVEVGEFPVDVGVEIEVVATVE
ncbi:MAG: Rid family detoxifying hydrolase [Haloarculaceae archaeon]